MEGPAWEQARSEAQLAAAWEERRYPPSTLVDILGRRLQVVFPGRRWGGPGPDFRGALIALSDGTLLRGDVELHRRASGWAAHRHAADPRYADVILHVVLEADAPALSAAGAALPTLVLPAPTLLSFPPVPPCRRAPPEIERLVMEAGRERFRAHAARFEGDLSVADPSQVLWRGIAEGLGYSRNAIAFGRLAEAVPWLEAARVGRDLGSPALTGLLLGTAGLLEDATPAEWRWWSRFERDGSERIALPSTIWEAAAVRPANHPAVRCRGLAALALRFTSAAGRTLAESLLEAVAGALRVPGMPLWPLLLARPWIGRGRALAVVVNVVLPFAAAAGLEGAVDRYVRGPGEPPNRVTRYMAVQLGASGAWARTACGRQGLLQVFKSFCAKRLCQDCPVADAERLAAALTVASA